MEEPNDPKQFRFIEESEEEILEKIRDLKTLLIEANDAENKVEEATVLSYLGLAYFKISRFERALQYHEKYLALSTEREDTTGIGRAHCNIGCVYKATGDFISAKEHFEKAITIGQENDNKRALARIYNNLANIHESEGELAEALDCHQKRLAIAYELKDKNGIGKACASLGNIYHVVGDLEASIRYYQEMLKILREKLRIQDTLAEDSEDEGQDDFVDLDFVEMQAMEDARQNLQDEERKKKEAMGGDKRTLSLKNPFKKLTDKARKEKDKEKGKEKGKDKKKGKDNKENK